MFRRPNFLLLLLVLLHAGCAHRSARGDVDGGLIIPLGGQVEMPEDEQFLFPTPVFENPLPDYPPASVAAALPEQVVCLQILIDEGGAVAWSGLDRSSPDCPDADHPPLPQFVAAARDAVARWQFLAAAICTYPAGQAKNDDCTGPGVTVREVPVKLSYRFRFRLVDGKPRVTR